MFGFVYQGRTLYTNNHHILYSKVLSTKNSHYNRPDSRKSKRRLLGKVAPICNIFFGDLRTFLLQMVVLNLDGIHLIDLKLLSESFWKSKISMKNHHDHLKVEFSISYVGLPEVIWHQTPTCQPSTRLTQPPEASVALSNVGATACQYEAWKGREFVWISGSVRNCPKIGGWDSQDSQKPQVFTHISGKKWWWTVDFYCIFVSLFTAMEVMKKAGLWYMLVLSVHFREYSTSSCVWDPPKPLAWNGLKQPRGPTGSTWHDIH